MRMTTKGQYAIVALTHIKKRNDSGDLSPVRVEEISQTENISKSYLEQLFRKMRMSGLVKSVRGPGGGYVLCRGHLTYKDVLDSVGEEIVLRDELSDLTDASYEVVGNLSTIYRKMVLAFETILI